MRVLLVSPGFHGYHRAIATALAVQGHTVSTHVYDDHGGFAGRAWHQLRHQLPSKLGAGSLRRMAREETAGATAVVHQHRPEAVVVIKGDTLGDQFWSSLAGLPRITWLYDEVRRTRWSTGGLAAVGPVATYSARDARELEDAGLDCSYLPLAYDHRLVPTPTSARTARLTFIGARYSARDRVLSELHARQLPITAYGRDWSSHPVDRLRTWRMTAPTIPSNRDVPRAVAYDVMASSAATVNMHGDQDGFTMRTFEAAGVGAVELIDRDDVRGLYEPGSEVLTWTSTDQLVELGRRALTDQVWADAIRRAARARTLAEHTFDQRAVVLAGRWDTP